MFDNPATDTSMTTTQSRSLQDILDEYRNRQIQLARLQAQLDETTDPEMRRFLQDSIAVETSILASLTQEALNAGATQADLNQIDGEAQTAADNDPIDWQDWNGGENALLSLATGFYLGKWQGGLNTLNGATDIGIGLMNTGIDRVNPLGWLLGINPEIPTVEWSNGLITDEDPTLHLVSKWLGGNGVVALASLIPSGGFNPASFIGKPATVAPNLPAGQYPALVIDGHVYVARFHITAWELAGCRGLESFYGFAEINGLGILLRLFK